MQDERSTEEAQAAIRAAMRIVSDARRTYPARAAVQLTPIAKLGTVRIRGAEFELDKLWLLALLVLFGLSSVLALAYFSTQSLADSQDRAMALLTTPDVSPVHLAPQGGFGADVQAAYWSKPGADVAVLTLSGLRPVSGGTRYRWSARHGDHWIVLGGGTVQGEETLHLIATNPGLSTPPDAIWVTLEVADADPTLVERTVLSWSNHSSVLDE
jgi:hypothetical protein